jgi:signal transduction histidine kinase
MIQPMALLSKAGLYHKLLLGYLVLLSMMILPCAVSIYSLSELENFATSLARHDLEISTTIEYLKGLPPSMEAEGRRLVTLYREDAYQSLLVLFDDFREKLTAVQRYGSADIQILARDINQIIAEFEELAHTVETGHSENLPPKIMPIEVEREDEVKTLVAEIMASLDKLERSAKRDLRAKSSLISDNTSHAKKITLFLLLTAVAFALAAPWLLYKYIKQPIDLLRQGTEIIGQGRFQTIPVTSNDELGDLASAFNKMAARLKELDQLKSDFIAVASHELKTPLAAMVEAAKLLSEPQIGPLNDKQQRLVCVLNDSMTRFQRLIDELLHLSRLKANLVTIEKRPTDLNKILAGIVQTLEPAIKEKGITIDVEVLSDVKEVPVDEERIFRAFMNIIQNAVKFSPAGETIRILLDISHEKGKDWCKVGVIDSGPGVEAAEQEKIFDKFYQIQAMRRKDGTGLGLAIAREIILGHRGEIWVESPPSDSMCLKKGKGAAFYSLLPYS